MVHLHSIVPRVCLAVPPTEWPLRHFKYFHLTDKAKTGNLVEERGETISKQWMFLVGKKLLAGDIHSRLETGFHGRYVVPLCDTTYD